jgi:hypothetical protein
VRGPILMFLSLISSSSATAVATQTAPSVPFGAILTTAIDGNVRHDVVVKLSDALRDNYIFPDVGEKAAQRINAELAAGAYDDLFDPKAFATSLTSDIAAVAHDKHLSISSIGAPPGAPPSGRPLMPSAEAGITRADELPGRVGYIEVVSFPPLSRFKPTLDKAMLALKGSRALIIDDRRNGGGSPDGVAYLVSFLISPKQSVEINDIVSRVPKTNNFTRERLSSQPTPVSFATIPVYVLTSNRTFSGGEEFAYDVQTHKIGKIVGEITGGGANPTGGVDLGNGFLAMIPFGRAENPITKTNWEGRGVQPDIAVAAQDALKAALTRLGQKPVLDITNASLKQVFAPRSTPLPGTETAARQLIAGLVSGNPDYASMTPDFADLTREQLPMLRKTLLALGELRYIKFQGTGMMGGDEYLLAFTKGAMIVGVMLDPQGKVAGALLRPAPAQR